MVSFGSIHKEENTTSIKDGVRCGLVHPVLAMSAGIPGTQHHLGFV